ncbi:class I SAM-dependent methyltransferase [Falsiroseomonas sp.]|uniref:class I SAM-dependent methyltransferase n=1 Tax=Falsiroseomonas sp. TaxID=2870721 RepID=UPI003562C521
MNLYDLLQRPDRSVEIPPGAVEPSRRDLAPSHLGGAFAPGAVLRLRRAEEFRALRVFPRDLGWSLLGAAADAAFRIRIRAEGREALLWQHEGAAPGPVPVSLSWPLWAGQAGEFDLELENAGSVPLVLRSGEVFDPRAALRPLIRGRGVEVGPGLNPHVRPGAGVEVTYVEALPIEEWARNYAKGRQLTAADTALFGLYVIGDAQRLDGFAEGSLDFIFSSHVFEHLMNPLGVLRNWRARLAPGGAILGVVPDPGGCFDLRQPPSVAAEWEAEFVAGTWTLTPEKYERWCRWTEPRVTPESLVARNYSVHAHYYTPEGFRSLADRAAAHGFGFDLFLNTSVNAKDFGFVLWPR